MLSHAVDELIALEACDDDPVRGDDRRRRVGLASAVLSVLLHTWLLGSLAGYYMRSRTGTEGSEDKSRFVNLITPDDEEPVDPVRLELADPEDRETPQKINLFAASVGLVRTDTPAHESPPVVSPMADPSRPRPRMYDVPEGLIVSKTVVVPGTAHAGLIHLEAALDQITWEIAKHLQERKVLVVWLLDASGSLEKQRETVRQRLKHIYGELQALEQSDQFPWKDRPLLTGVVTYGQSTRFMVNDPTDKFEEIQKAFGTIENDPTGVENVFTAISQVLDRWGRYRVEHGRRILLMTVTDEAGDDFGRPLDLAIAKCRRHGAVGYAIGPAAPFGRRRGYVPYRAPEDGRLYQLPVDLGPESVVVENVDLPFWYDGSQYENISSGFGPYALNRWVRETGGVFFLTNMTTMAGLATIGRYDPDLMKAFEPDYRYGAPDEFLRDLSKHPVRMAVFAAAQHSQTTKLRAAGTPRLNFQLAPNNFRQTLTSAQESAAVTQLAVESILAKLPTNAEKAYASEPSMRWRLAFSLNYGRLLAQKVRATEYNTACAQLKSAYSEADVANRVNRLSFRPDRELRYALHLRKLARSAEDHLQRVIADAPGTPWAVLASRELKDGLGIRVVESYVPPPPPQPPQPATPVDPPKRPKFAPEPPKPAVPQPPKPPPVLPKL